ncbi:hypothetical protein Fuma_06047 [Fuerstiella marisgermanici]|uniref:Uncharacterized protein n=1 Tax=Fuerstiella marisgermanici TaxID=1891926 RepID=A0A1P8WQS0_9PLAN|nr:hypothetical protein Fuma_06047 [Fuerstiella marisgermanici]
MRGLRVIESVPTRGLCVIVGAFSSLINRQNHYQFPRRVAAVQSTDPKSTRKQRENLLVDKFL